MSDPPLVPGYTLGAVLGRGAFGEVRHATRDADGLPVALKILRSDDEYALLRFAREARAAARVDSTHVCRVLDANTSSAPPLFIAYERLFGESLEARLERDGDLSLGETLPVADDPLEALASAHAAGVVHRDVKPGNVFLERATGDAVRARLLDFGVAKMPDEGDEPLKTTGGSTLGTLAYMAPEQAGSAEAADPRADLYGVGAVMFRALAGRPPFSAASPATLLALKLDREAPSLAQVTGLAWPTVLEAFLQRMLARDPARRFASAHAAREALDGVDATLRRAVEGS